MVLVNNLGVFLRNLAVLESFAALGGLVTIVVHGFRDSRTAHQHNRLERVGYAIVLLTYVALLGLIAELVFEQIRLRTDWRTWYYVIVLFAAVAGCVLMTLGYVRRRRTLGPGRRNR